MLGSSLQLPVGNASCFCDKIPGRSYLKGGRICLGHKYEGSQFIMSDRHGGWVCKVTHLSHRIHGQETQRKG